MQRIVRLLMAHATDGVVEPHDVNSVFDLVHAQEAERRAVLASLSAAEVRVAPSELRPDSMSEAEPTGPYEDAVQGVQPAPRAASEADVEAARRVLRSDRRSKYPSRRVLTSQEEIGLAALMRDADLPMDRPLPEGYRAGLNPLDTRARAFDAFMVHNMRLVWSIAQTHHSDHMELEDIVQHGMLGLHRAVEKFDATKGYKFSTYATWWIRQSIGRGMANEGRLIRLPVHILEQVQKVLAARNRMLAESDSCHLSSLSRVTGLSVDKVAEYLQLSAGVVSLDKPIEEGGGDTLGDFVLTRAADEADPAQLIDRMAVQRIIRDALLDLSEREALVISLREGLDTNQPLTLDEIGKMFGVTRERIRQIEGKARGKLRDAVVARGLAPLRANVDPIVDQEPTTPLAASHSPRPSCGPSRRQ